MVDEYTKSPAVAGTEVVDGFTVKLMLFVVSKYPEPETLLRASVAMRNFVDRTNLTEAVKFAKALSAGTETEDDAIMAIKCSDTIPRVKSVEGESLVLATGEVVGVD